jgi:hypothetical protein
MGRGEHVLQLRAAADRGFIILANPPNAEREVEPDRCYQVTIYRYYAYF